MAIDAKTRLCAVIGWPIEHSLSPAIHNAAFEEAGLNYVYTAFGVPPGELPGAVTGVRALGLHGLSVTIPHKVDLVPLLDELDGLAEKVGSVNTVVNRDGQLHGYTTDGPGALEALRAGGADPRGRDVLVLGSGGAARAITFALVWDAPPGQIRILGIVPEEVARLVDDLREAAGVPVEGGPMGDLEEEVARSEILVHATPVGMSPGVEESIIDEEWIQPHHAVFDAVYNPLETELLRRARRRGARVIPGLGMFIQQAALQYRLWTNRDAPLSTMERVVRAALEAPS